MSAMTQLTAPTIFGKMHFQLISEKEVTHEIKRDGITSFHGIHVLLSLCAKKQLNQESGVAN